MYLEDPNSSLHANNFGRILLRCAIVENDHSDTPDLVRIRARRDRIHEVLYRASEQFGQSWVDRQTFDVHNNLMNLKPLPW